jgi:hypothetical protein
MSLLASIFVAVSAISCHCDTRRRCCNITKEREAFSIRYQESHILEAKIYGTSSFLPFHAWFQKGTAMDLHST